MAQSEPRAPVGKSSVIYGGISVDKAEFLDRLADEIDKRLPAPHDGRKSELRRQALEVGLSYETLAGYVAGQNEPGVLNWRKLCQIFPDLEHAVFGTSSEIERQLAEVRKDIRALHEKHGKSNGDFVTLEHEGKAS